MFSDVLFGENLEELFKLVECLRMSTNESVVDDFCCELENAIDKFADELYEYGVEHDKRIDNARNYIISQVESKVEEIVNDMFDNF